jgi:predicted transcriptional regulator/transcriptional regulator with XRE-family HTH domain
MTKPSEPREKKAELPRLGAKVRTLRRRESMSQAQLAERLAISPSYLNLIENNRRPLPSQLLIRLAQIFNVELSSFTGDEEGRSIAGLLEAFADPLFEEIDIVQHEVRELAQTSPATARAVLKLYRAYQGARASSDHLSSRVYEGEGGPGIPDGLGNALGNLPSEEVSDFIQRANDHFPELEHGAEEVWRKGKLDFDDLFAGLVRHLDKTHKVTVKITRGDRSTLRRYDPHKRILTLSELLPTRSRKIQLAHQLCMLSMKPVLDRLCADERLTSEGSRSLARVALANYFAGAVLMPYEPFLQAAREQRYDLDMIGRRFGVGFEQVCHRFCTLQRPGAVGVPFHMIRIDIAGNISKRFSASGIQFARFAGACPRWNIFQAFPTPGMIRIQLSRMPDGHVYFCLARTVQQDSQGFHALPRVNAIGLGCRVEHAPQLVYADGLDLKRLDSATPVGVTCRLCDRTDCEQRAFPSLRSPLQLDENVRGVSLYAPPRSSED